MNTVTSSDGTSIAYDRTGGGAPVILIGGAFSYRRFPGFLKLADLLSPDFTVYNYDRRGRGDSGDTAPYAVEREIEDLDAMIKEAGGAAHVFGMSSGAALAITAAAQGSDIRSLALYEPPYMVGDEGHRPPADSAEHLDRLVADGRRSEAARYFFTQVMGAPAFVAVIMRLLPVWKRLTAVAHTLPHDHAIMGDFSFPAERVAGIDVPTVAIAGGKSPATLVAATRAVAAANPRIGLELLEGQNHNVDFKVLAPAIADHFRKF
ncbi:MAG: alpha/beta hydrolase [Streptosporangiaceae bacterium]